MRLAGFLVCILAVLPMGLASQSGGYGVGRMETMLVGPNGTVPDTVAPSICPVSMQASHLSDGSMVRTRFDHPSGIGQRLHLKLISPDQRTIDSATFNLRGWTGTGRAEKLGQALADNDPALKMQTLTLYLKPGADRTATVDVWAPGLTSIVSVELASVKFMDGSTWTPPEGKSCRVAPDLFMAVNQR